jgi:Holliday junction resolvase RusA-like endonuclease
MKLVFPGQVKSGKNSMQIDPRTGRHYPLPAFSAWRDEMVLRAKTQAKNETFSGPVSAIFHYYSGDRRRRDAPGMLDAIFHVLEKAVIVSDDSLIQHIVWRTEYDKLNPRVEISLEAFDSPLGTIAHNLRISRR